MEISKFNFGVYLTRAKRHYNLSVDDFVVVDESAMVLSSAKYYSAYISIAVNPDKFNELKKINLPDSDVRGHIKLIEGVYCRPVQLPEISARRWSGSCWVLTREYLTATRKAALTGPSVSANRQKELQRDIELLDLVDATLPATTNKAKALVRVRSVALYLGIPINDLVLCDQSIKCLVDNVKMDNDTLVLGIDKERFEKLRKKVTVPSKTKFYADAKNMVGYEFEPATYIVTMPTGLYNTVCQAPGIHHDAVLDIAFLSIKHI